MSLVGNFTFNNHDRSDKAVGVGPRSSIGQGNINSDGDDTDLRKRSVSLSHARSNSHAQTTVESSGDTSVAKQLIAEKHESAPSAEDTEEEREKEVQDLARAYSNAESFSYTGHPFEESMKDTLLDPKSSKFSGRAWVRAMLKMNSDQPDLNPQRSAAFVCKDLNVHGFGQATDYQKSVSNVLLGGVGLVRRLAGLSKPRRVDILRNFDMLVKPGEMLVVLGPPGSGCSTLLKTIAGETHGFTVDKNSYMNYQGISAPHMHTYFRGEAIYTAEVDVHFPMLSVGDTLDFAARARAPRNIPAGIPRSQFSRHLRDVVMAIFGISHTVNTRVGNDFIRGVSGGERKRVTIAEAALSGAPLQCWDNSTRGLDSANAIEFCKTLRMNSELANTTAVVAIYQAPQSAYDLFDKAAVLYEGREIYFGSTTKAKDYFLRQGFICPDRQTDADFLTSMTSPQERLVQAGFENKVPRTPDDFAEAWNKSPERQQLLSDIERFDKEHPIGGADRDRFVASRRAQQAKAQRVKSPYTLSYAQQVMLCLWRGFQRLKGDPSLTFTQLFGNLLTALIIGSVFYNLQPDTNSFYQRGALLFFAILINAFGSALEILTLYAQRPIVEKHNRYALYHPSAEAFASMLTDMPYKITNSITFNLVLYFMTNLKRTPGAFFFFVLITFFLTLTMSMFFRVIASVSRTLSQAMAPAAVLILAIVIYTGFAIPTRYMLGWSRWINYLDPVAYGFEALMINEFSGRNFTCSNYVPTGPGYGTGTDHRICSTVGSRAGSSIVNGDAYMNSSFQYYASHRWRNLGIIIAFMLGLMCAYLWAAEKVSAKKSKGEVLVFRRGHIPATLKDRSVDEENFDTEKVISRQDAAAAHIEKQTAVFQWRDVCYDIKIKGGERRILDHVDGWVQPGTLTALMGASGAGKTTLLDALATRTTTGVLAGEMLVDGMQRDASFQRKTGYVQQQDLHLETSTVREALNFSALLRQPATISKADKLAYVEEIIKLLDMQEYVDAVIGVPGEGLNVEQRKRLTIAVELAAKPELLLFLDEPTSGLDSQTSWAICDLMEKLTQNGQAILCTIHQPSAMLFQRFDRLLLLEKGEATGGKTIYFGDVGENSSVVRSYFERNGATPCPPNGNPAEWMLEVIGAAPGSFTDIDWHQVWRSSPEYRAVHQELDRMKEELPHTIKRVNTQANKASYREFAAHFTVQLMEVQKRVFQQYWRTPSYIYAKAALCLFSGLFIGFSFFQAANSQQGLQNQMFSMFMLLTIFGQLVQQIMPHFVTQRALYEARERPSKTYSWQAFMLSNIIVELPWNSLMAVIIFVSWYYPIGLYRNAEPTDSVHARGGLMFLFILTFLLFTSTFTNMVIAAIDTAETGGNIANLLFSLSLIFCGVLASPQTLPGFWIFMYRVSPFTYLIDGMLSTALANTDVVCATNEYLHFTPPSGQSCAAYMKPYIAARGGYLLENTTNPGACEFCPIKSTNVFLAGVNSHYDLRWRNFGIMWVYIIFNVFVAVGVYWLARVPKKPKRGKGGKAGKSTGEDGEKAAGEVSNTGKKRRWMLK